MLDFRNLNTLWSSIVVETLVRCGLKTAIVCPGSRSAPLVVAFAQHPEVEAIPVLDERSASFFALGIARQTGTPVALVCTSGTAGANFYPAVIEAREGRVPLLVLSADRPPELRDCNAGQAIDQQKLFGNYPNYYCELATPALELSLLAYLRQRIVQCYQQTRYPQAGAVHINVPFRDPLAPIEQPEVMEFAATFPIQFFDHLRSELLTAQPKIAASELTNFWTTIAGKRGVIIAGVAQARDAEKYCAAIAQLSRCLGFPVLAEGLSPVRNQADRNPNLISTYDAILRNSGLADALSPEVVIRVGEMPTSKVLREWLARYQPQTWVIDESARSIDPLHGYTQQLPISIESLMEEERDQLATTNKITTESYLQGWLKTEQQVRQSIDEAMRAEESLFEGKVSWLLARSLPEETPIFIANSMPVRDVEYFWPSNDRRYIPFFNRGANGIDGTLSTALGVAHQNQSSVMLTGDLALLHDTNGFLIRQHFQGHLTIVLLNNEGGGIFGMLPIAQFDPPFDEFFRTPQNLNFAHLCQTYGIEHQLITSWEHLQSCLNPLPKTGIRVLEVPCDRRYDTHWRKSKLPKFAADLETMI